MKMLVMESSIAGRGYPTSIQTVYVAKSARTLSRNDLLNPGGVIFSSVAVTVVVLVVGFLIGFSKKGDVLFLVGVALIGFLAVALFSFLKNPIVFLFESIISLLSPREQNVRNSLIQMS
jgi:small-conductance mechanosensitive channel